MLEGGSLKIVVADTIAGASLVLPPLDPGLYAALVNGTSTTFQVVEDLDVDVA